MKKAVVYYLTAMLVTGASLSPTVAYAETAPDTEVVADEVEPTSETATDTNQIEKNTSDSETAETPQVITEQDATEGQNMPDTSEDEKPPEEVVFDLEANMNLDAVREYIHSADTLGTTVVYFIQQDTIVLGYNYSSGDVVTSTLKNVTDTSRHLSFSSQAEDGGIIWNKLKGYEGTVNTGKLSEYIKSHSSDFQVINADSGMESKTDIAIGDTRPDLLLFYKTDGEFIGTADLKGTEANTAIYDEKIGESSANCKIDYTLSDDKRKASVNVSFDFDYPKVLGGEELVNFEIWSADKSVRLVDSTTSLNYCNDVIGKNTGKIGGIVLERNGDFILLLRGSQKEYETSFTIRGVDDSEPAQKPVSTVQASVSFSELPSGILKGTPTSITMYSDVEAVLLFNGESSVDLTKEHSFTVTHNGAYSWTAVTADGVETSGTFNVDCFVDEASAIDLGSYGDGGSTFLPQTGGMSTLVVTLSGIFLMIGGIAVAKKDAILALISKYKREV